MLVRTAAKSMCARARVYPVLMRERERARVDCVSLLFACSVCSLGLAFSCSLQLLLVLSPALALSQAAVVFAKIVWPPQVIIGFDAPSAQ